MEQKNILQDLIFVPFRYNFLANLLLIINLAILL